MATAQPGTSRATTRANGKDQKAVAAKAAKQDLHDAQEAAGQFASAVKASATHYGQHITQRVTDKVAKTANKVQGARYKAEGKVRDRPLIAIGVAAGVGLLIGMLTRR